MADPKHLKELKKGAAAWNRWRRRHPDVQPSLTLAGLHNAELTHADLTGAHLGAADLSRAYLRFAALVRANLDGANSSP